MTLEKSLEELKCQHEPQQFQWMILFSFIREMREPRVVSLMKNRIMINNGTALWILDWEYQSIYMYSVILEKEIPINIFILRKNVKIFVLSWLSPTLICLCFLLSMKVINNKRVHFQTGFCSYTHICHRIVSFGISQTSIHLFVTIRNKVLSNKWLYKQIS